MAWTSLNTVPVWTGDHLQRWLVQGYDEAGNKVEYAFGTNPNESNVPVKVVSLNSMVTTAGKVLVAEGSGEPPTMKFSGVFVDHGLARADEQLDAMIGWLLRRSPVFLVDHYGRRYRVIIQSFEPVMQPTSSQQPYRHLWSMEALVLNFQDGRTFRYTERA